MSKKRKKKSGRPGNRMGWESGKSRWRMKPPGGKAWTSRKCERTDLLYEAEAWADWLRYQAEAAAVRNPHQREYDLARSYRTEMLAWIAAELDAVERTGVGPTEAWLDPEAEELGPPEPADPDEFTAECERDRAWITDEIRELARLEREPTPLPLDGPKTLWVDPLAGKPEAARRRWQMRISNLDSAARYAAESIPPEDKTVRASMARYVAEKKLVGRKWGTIRRIEQRLETVTRYAGGDALDRVDEAWASRVYREVLGRSISASDKKGTWGNVTAWIKWAYDEDEIDREPKGLRRKSIEVPKKKVRPQNPEWLIETLREVRNSDVRTWVLLMANTGMQPVDLADLRIDDVDWEAGTVRRARVKTRDRSDDVPEVTHLLWNETLTALRDSFDRRASPQDGYGDRILLNRNGIPVWRDGASGKTDNVSRAYYRIPKPDGGSRPSIKEIRSTGSSLLRSLGYQMDLIARWLGHSPSGVADVYYVGGEEDPELAGACVRLGELYGFETSPDRLPREVSINPNKLTPGSLNEVRPMTYP